MRRSWQDRLRDAFSELGAPREEHPTPPRPLRGNGDSPRQQYQYHRTPPPIPPRPAPPVPPRPSPITLRALRLLQLPVIEAELVLADGQVVLRRQNLDSDLGNDNGTFSFGGSNFSKSARHVYLHDTTLYAELKTRDGPEWFADKVGIEVDIPPDLKLEDIAIKTIEYHSRHSPRVPNDRSRLCVSEEEYVHSLRLVSDFVLGAECRQADGGFATSYVDLDTILGNEKGVLVRGGQGFSLSSRNIRLNGTTLTAEVAYDKGWPEHSIDLSRLVRCASGRLVPFNVQNALDVQEAVHSSGVPNSQPLSGCRSITLLGRCVLIAKCILRGGRTQEAAFKLDKLFGVIDGRMRPFGHDFHLWPKILDVHLDGSTWTVYAEGVEPQSFDLDEFLANVNGQLVLKNNGPCDGCKKAFRAGRLYSPMGNRQRTRLDFKISDVNPQCGLCQIIESVIHETVPFIRSYEVFLECWSEYFGKYPIKTVELEVRVNNQKLKYRLYLDSDDEIKSKAYSTIPVKEHGSAWYEPSQRWPLITSLIDECSRNHTDCAREGTPALPTRYLDIGLNPYDNIRVATSQQDTGRYACLSHCWGQGNKNRCTLTSETYARYTSSIPVDELPRNYHDAISTCRFLGLRYLWIDSLCILQDSKADWQIESPKMIKYYGRCHVCIAATNISGPDLGLELADRPNAIRGKGTDQDGVPYALVAYPSHLVEPIPHFSRADKTTVQRNFPLMTRAWVLQERWLAPRTLHFCGKEIVFECSEGLKCECGHAEDDYTLPGGDEERVMAIENIKDGVVLKKRKGNAIKWTQFVSAYSSLSLTFGSDHLPAISGLARDFADRRSDRSPGKYLAGLWSGSLHRELVWFVGEPLLRFRDTPKEELKKGKHEDAVSPITQNAKPDAYIAPSWSWASVFETIRYRSWDDKSTLQCDVLDSSISLDGTDEYGAVAPGCSLTVRSKLARTTWSISSRNHEAEYILSNIRGTQRLDQYETQGIRFLPDHTLSNTKPCHFLTQEDVYIMPVVVGGFGLIAWSFNANDKAAMEKELQFAERVKNTMCLVLRKLSGTEYSMPTYERVGFTEFANVRAGAENEDRNQYIEQTFVIL